MLASLVLLAVGGAQDLDCSRFLAGADPTTRLAIELCLERVELVETETLFQKKHPSIALQKRCIRKLERTLAAMAKTGHAVDHERVNMVLDLLLHEAKSDLIAARQMLKPTHPRLALLELRLQSVGQVVARRALVE